MPLIEINPDLDREALAEEFAKRGRVQVRNVLTRESAELLRDLLMTKTPWLLGWLAGDQSGRNLRNEELMAMSREQMAEIERRIIEAVVREEFCYIYSSYPLDQALMEHWQPGSPHEQLVHDLRGEPFAALLRDVTGHSEIVGADGYATMYAPGHFLSRHTDEGVKWRRIDPIFTNSTSGFSSKCMKWVWLTKREPR